MNERSILNAHRLPARLDVNQTAELLGFMEHDIPVLIRVKLLKPLGDPAANAHKFFSATELQQLMGDRSWLDRATKSVSRYWRTKNQKRDALLNAA